MKWGEAATVFTAYGLWRATGLARAGVAVASALASADETNRTATGVLLVRAGERSLPLLQGNVVHGTAVALSLRVLGDIGGRRAAATIEPFTRSADPAIAGAAADALKAAGSPA